MKRFALLVLAALPLFGLSAQSAGGGVSVFVPESLYRRGNGTIAFEQGLSTSIGIGSILSVPIGFAYHSADGFLLEHADAAGIDAPAFYGDALIPYAGLKARVPLGSVFYLEAEAGAALAWAFSLKPTADFAAALASNPTQRVAVAAVSVDQGLGWGLFAGGAFGVRLGSVSVDLGAAYRSIRIPATVDAEISRVSGSEATAESVRLSDADAVLKGVSIRLGGSVAF